MRTLKLQVQITVDGCVAGANGELDWMTFESDERLGKRVWELHDPVDLILMGRKMSKGFLDYWNKSVNEEGPEQKFAKKMVETPKIVFSKTLETIDDENTELCKGDFREEIAKLKAADGGDIIVYGGAEFVRSLIENDLIDEYHLIVNPAAIGDGLRIFTGLDKTKKFKLVSAEAFGNGEVELFYEPVRN